MGTPVNQPSDELRTCPACGRQFANNVEVCPDDGTILAAPATDPLIGTLFADRYRILEVLGCGGMSVVYKAQHTLMDRLVAIKVLKEVMADDSTSLQRFQREARAASRLSHPNVISVHDFGLLPGNKAFMVMDFVKGTNLTQIIKSADHLDAVRLLRIFSQVASGLVHAHEKGVLHRDIKPGNIMVLQEGGEEQVKIVDFGIAKFLSESAATQSLTKTGEAYGSPLYMSPEHCLSYPLDARSDIYSLGCVMYEAATGLPALIGSSAFETMQKHLSQMPKSFAKRRPDLKIPTAIENIVCVALQKEPAARYQSMQQMKEDIDVALRLLEHGEHESVQPVTPAGGAAFETTDTFGGATMPTAQSAVTGKNRVESRESWISRRVLIGVAAPAILVTSVAIAVLTYQDSQRHAQEEAPWRQYQRAGVIAKEASNFTEAANFLALALKDMERTHAAESQVADVLVELADVYRASANLAKAEELYDRAMVIDNKEGQHLRVSRDLLGLARVQLARSDVKGAREYVEQAVDLTEQGTTERAAALIELARVQVQSQQLDGAEQNLRQAVATYESQLGKEDPRLAAALYELANLLRLKGKLDQAESLYGRALTIWEAKYGPDHPVLAEVLADYGKLLRHQDKDDQAAKLQVREDAIRKKRKKS